MAEFTAARGPEQGPSDGPTNAPSDVDDNDPGGVGEQRLALQPLAEEERRARREYHTLAAFWAVMGAIVVLYLFFALLGAVNPAKAPGATIVIIVVALVWLVHAWERLHRGGHVSRSDRERRGF